MQESPAAADEKRISSGTWQRLLPFFVGPVQIGAIVTSQ